MNWLSVFTIYNVKNFKKERLVIILTMLSIMITTTLSIVVPIISASLDSYNRKNIREANGGDLFVKAFYESKAFDEEISAIKAEGYNITYKRSSSAFFQKLKGRKFYANLISGEKNIKGNEIIIDSSMAKNLSVKVGDIIEVKTDAGTKPYTVIEIEGIPKGLTNDETIIGYGKINESVNFGNLLYIEGNTDGELLKERLLSLEDGYIYSSIKDKERELKNNIGVQLAAFGILTTMGYILSSVVIITTSIMLIIGRRRDISIMKLISLKNRDIKNALRLELAIIILIPVIFSVIASNILSALILKMNFIPESINLASRLNIFLRGIILNILFFAIFSNLPLLIIDDFKGLWLLKEDEAKSGVIRKRIFIYLILLIPVILLIYSVYIGSAFNFATSLAIIMLLLLFLLVSSLGVKLLASFRYRSPLLMYSFKNIKKNYLIFVLLIVSFSVTLVFMLISLSLNSTVRNSMNKSLAETLPYNYMVADKAALNMNSVLTKENGVEGYIKSYKSTGKVLNPDIKNKTIVLNEIKEEDYNLNLKIVEGGSVFDGKEGCLITAKYKKQNNLNVGDILNVSYKDQLLALNIKGIYDNSIIDSMAIIIPYKGYGDNSSYYVKASGTKWLDKLGDTPVISIDILGGALSMYIGKFTNIFKALSLMVVIASLIFNMNLLSITFIEERKEETVIRALGLGKDFLTKVYVLKGTILILASSTLAYSFYSLTSKLLLQFLGVNAITSSLDLLLILPLSILLAFVTFVYPFSMMKKYNCYEFLREN